VSCAPGDFALDQVEAVQHDLVAGMAPDQVPARGRPRILPTLALWSGLLVGILPGATAISGDYSSPAPASGGSPTTHLPGRPRVDVHPKSGKSPADREHWAGKETPWPVDAVFPFRHPHLQEKWLPGTADAGTINPPAPIIRPHVKPYSREFRHQAVLLTRSKGVPVTHVVRELGISNGTLRDWIAQARHDPR